MNRPIPPDGDSALTAFQVQVARLFFALPASHGFLLAGGAALLAQHLTTRPTQDLDFFTRTGVGNVPAAADALEGAATERGWTVERHTGTDTFCRLVIHGPEDLLVDLAVDAAPGRPPTASFIGPTFAPDELAGRKLIALFDRAAARDFADVYVLALRYTKQRLLDEAAALDTGFDPQVLAQMMAALDRYSDSDLAVAPDRIAPLRQFFHDWRHELQ